MRVTKKIYEHVNIIYTNEERERAEKYINKHGYFFTFSGPIIKGKAKGKYRVCGRREIERS